ncbi:MAG: glycosyltransferase family 2 protein [Chroococcidiopsidaceae cyanobacterium CP_BM_ER_R8_30]|nr:glycosyltransferase family 2 protein [Chroococcidiopsidaceae cyanobacterium CP_BM_ER_R8_30]
MNKLLTIAIPTFNRAELLNKQLTWLAQALRGFEAECEIFVSDNCSTDHTQEIIKKWQELLGAVTFRSSRNIVNLGVMTNIAYCLKSASSKYVWTIGDDDPIQERTLSYVLKILKRHPDLTLMYLNCTGRESLTGQLAIERWFDSDSDEPTVDGKAAYQTHLNRSFGGILFISAVVYQTNLVQLAVQKWPAATSNWASQAYWAGFCAAHGSVIVTKDVYLECTMGASILDRDPTWSLRVRYDFIPEIYAKLLEIGYPSRFCRKMILQNLRSLTDWKIFFGAFRRWPILSIKLIVPYLGLASVCVWEFLLPPDLSKMELLTPVYCLYNRMRYRSAKTRS